MDLHVPVMTREVLNGLALKAGGVYWDGTFGRGGHSTAILAGLGKGGALFASDRDEQAEEAARALLNDSRFHFRRCSFEEALDWVPDGLAGFVWDLGCSTPQLKDPERGFSFREAGPLDMRMDRSQMLTAAEIVNGWEEKPLADLIYRYGEERLSRKIAARIATRRKQSRIEDTLTLAEICREAYPRRYHRIDPATRTFQALRIAVNGELDQLTASLPLAMNKLAPGGRGVVISFHSLEDRIVKHEFRDAAKTRAFAPVTKKPLVACDDERNANPAARSAKLRVIEKGSEVAV